MAKYQINIIHDLKYPEQVMLTKAEDTFDAKCNKGKGRHIFCSVL